jgi:hypothetical protein
MPNSFAAEMPTSFSGESTVVFSLIFRATFDIFRGLMILIMTRRRISSFRHLRDKFRWNIKFTPLTALIMTLLSYDFATTPALATHY